jgi:hypothetical protein
MIQWLRDFKSVRTPKILVVELMVLGIMCVCSSNELSARIATSHSEQITFYDDTSADNIEENNEIDLESKPPKLLHAGIYTSAKASINAGEIPTGWKTFPVIAPYPDFGITMMYDLSSTYKLRAMLDMGISSTSIGIRPFIAPNDSNSTVLQSSYMSFAPMLMVSEFGYGGVAFSIPMGSVVRSLDGSTLNSSFSGNGQKVSLGQSMLIELRFGGRFPLIRDDNGTLDVLMLGSYSLSGVYSKETIGAEGISNIYSPLTVQPTIYNPIPASLSIGLRYMFRWSL